MLFSKRENISSPFVKSQILLKSVLSEEPKHSLEINENLQPSSDEFSKDDDSTFFLLNRTRNTKLERQFKKKQSTITAESSHTLTMDAPRGCHVYAKRDVAKSTKQKLVTVHNKNKVERKIAALEDAETRSHMELDKPIKFFAVKDYQKNTN